MPSPIMLRLRKGQARPGWGAGRAHCSGTSPSPRSGALASLSPVGSPRRWHSMHAVRQRQDAPSAASRAKQVQFLPVLVQEAAITEIGEPRAPDLARERHGVPANTHPSTSPSTTH